MKTFKLIDFWLNVFLYAVLFTWIITFHSLDNIMTAYCIMGAYQVFSMIIHECNKCFVTRWSIRRKYHWIALASLLAIPFGTAYIMILASPLMAAYYILLCQKEVFVKMKRPLALLK